MKEGGDKDGLTRNNLQLKVLLLLLTVLIESVSAVNNGYDRGGQKVYGIRRNELEEVGQFHYNFVELISHEKIYFRSSKLTSSKTVFDLKIFCLPLSEEL